VIAKKGMKGEKVKELVCLNPQRKLSEKMKGKKPLIWGRNESE